ncbi:hypothetical protein [Christiangramia sp. SM2212]|uniref:DUF4384 domain-containing protein n=1 Tax=Christiangramia sediminicola TaxID=3073267 RepID=A0ABU1EPZ9_9FLAO|nr:hypothetical protein [Christiangramia sp. SM2212]MDR5590464.1 hypothetical protein [Christiangramia sp. SM2212]
MRHLLTLTFLFVAFSINAQNFLNGALATYSPAEPESYTGSPFYEEEFVQGVVRNSEGQSQNLLMRYNAVQDVVVLKLRPQSSKLFLLPPVSDIFYEMGDYTYMLNDPDLNIPASTNYYASFYKGSKSHFIGVPRLDLNSKVKAKTGYEDDIPANFKVEMKYYLSINGGDFEEVNFRPRQLSSLFENPEMARYVADLKIKKADDVVSLLKYYENLK